MDGVALSRINLAVDQCLERCSKASTPPALTIEGFCKELLAAGWDAVEIKLVSSSVTRVLVQRALGQ